MMNLLRKSVSTRAFSNSISIFDTLEYKQMQAYLLNGKYDKADKLISNLRRLNTILEPDEQLFLLKQRYQVLLHLSPKDAEM